jgi:hypothetical protein
MIVHSPEIVRRDEQTIVWSRVELAQKRADFPDYLWYSIPNRYASYISLQSDAFLIPALLAAMGFGEDIQVRGTISPRLAYLLEEYQFILSFRFPKDLRQVEIIYQRLEQAVVQPQAVGAPFSGGVDSLFTLWSHLPQNQSIPCFQISHLLFVHGFDIFNANRSAYPQLFTRYQSALLQMGVELVPLETNLVSAIIPRRNFAYFYSPILAGCAHFLAGLFKRFFIPSSWSYDQLQKRASCSSPLTDRLLSSDTLDIIHHGATRPRVEKIREICDWEFAHTYLRVCPHSGLGDSSEMSTNCSRCEKCLRTMIPIYALGRMEKFSTFTQPFRTDRDGLKWARKFSPYPGFVGEIIPFVKKHRPAMVPWLRAAKLLGYLRYWSLALIPGFMKKRLRSFGYFIDPFDEKGANENPQILRIISEHKS